MIKNSPSLNQQLLGGQEMAMGQKAYSVLHRNFKIQYRNKQIKKVYSYLKEHPEHQQYYLYCEDVLLVLTRVFKESLIHKEQPLSAHFPNILWGKHVLQLLYSSYLSEVQVTSGKRVVKRELLPRMSHFFTLMISFMLQVAYLYRSKEKAAMFYYVHTATIVDNIARCFPKNYKLASKVCEFYTSYGSYLIEIGWIDLALLQLQKGIQAETNLLYLLDMRLKGNGLKKQAYFKCSNFDRLFALLYNLMLCFRIQCRAPLVHFFTTEYLWVCEQKDILSKKDRKHAWSLENKKAVEEYLIHIELAQICSMFFQETSIKDHQSLFIHRNKPSPQVVERNQTEESARPIQMVKNTPIKRKVVSHVSYHEQQINAETLLFGTNLFREKSIKKPYSSNNNNAVVKYNEMTKNLIKKRKKIIFKPQNLLKKQVDLKRQVDYSKLKNKFNRFWVEQAKDSNKKKQKICVLRYKSQSLNYKGFQIKENVIDEIKMIDKKWLLQEMQTAAPKEEPTKQQELHGIALFKNIILKHFKYFQIRKNQILNALKKQQKVKYVKGTQKLEVNGNNSVQYLLKQMEHHNISRMKKITQHNQETETDRIFLVKGQCTMIPKLFQSYFKSNSGKH